ncbi:MAG: type II toxin-antitoxin system RelE family toxin [Anaerolineae bacterium]
MSDYRVYITPRAWDEINDLPGHMRQRVKRVIETLAKDPHPARSQALRGPSGEWVSYRLRLDRWRIVYTVTESGRVVDILAVRKRPPYDYGDLGRLLEEANL